MAITDFDVYSKYWKDKYGNVYTLPSRSFSHLRASKFKTHERVRDFVFQRDNYTCKICGSVGLNTYPFRTFDSFLVVDHKISIKNGGDHHPRNLQTLCDRCNCRKAATVDRNYAR